MNEVLKDGKKNMLFEIRRRGSCFFLGYFRKF